MRTTENTSNLNRALQTGSHTWGHALVRFSGVTLIVSAGVKFLHPAKAVAYMGSMGYEGSTFYVIALLELVIAVLFLLPATRSLGLLFVSSYLGGAIAAHLAIHRFFTGGPFLVYMAHHPYVGATIPGFLLVAAWLGAYLCRPVAQSMPDQVAAGAQHQSRKALLGVAGSISPVG